MTGMTMKPLILIVEDEAPIVTLLRYNLEREGFRVVEAGDGEEALLLAAERKPDLVLLDWMLPLLSGIEVCRRLRRAADSKNVPIIMLTARGEEGDRVRGLNSGADDYVTKPFSARELMARVHAVLRRRGGTASERPQPPIRLAGLALHPDRMAVAYEGRPIEVTTTEFRLLACLLDPPGRVFSRAQLLEAALPESDALERVVDSHFRNLRKKLPPAIRIEPVRGVGYRVTVDADR